MAWSEGDDIPTVGQGIAALALFILIALALILALVSV